MCEFIGVSQRVKSQDLHHQIFIISLHVRNNVQFTLKVGSTVCTNVNNPQVQAQSRGRYKIT